MTVVAIVLAVVMLVVVLTLLLKRQLSEKYAVLWLVISVLVLVLGLFPQLLEWLTAVAGVQVPANLLFALSILLLLGVGLHLSWELSRAEEELRRVAEEAALASAHLVQLEARLEALEAERAPASTEAPAPAPADEASTD